VVVGPPVGSTGSGFVFLPMSYLLVKHRSVCSIIQIECIQPESGVKNVIVRG
jgi:hypothetical protein